MESTVTKKNKHSRPETTAARGTIFTLAIDRLVETYTKETNPNKMTEEQFAALVAVMRKEGCLQNLVVEDNDDGTWRIVDGHHRYWAAKIVGLTELPCIERRDTTDQLTDAVGIGMNRIRGASDLVRTGEVLRDLVIEQGLPATDVALSAGLSEDELGDIIANVGDAEDDIGASIGDAMGDEDDEDEEAAPKPFMLEVRFDDRETLRKVRRALRKAAGKGGDLAKGLVNALGLEN